MEYGDLSAVWGYEGSRGKPNLGNLWGNGMRTAKLRNYATEARFKLAYYDTAYFKFERSETSHHVSCSHHAE
jgi:hypothetical protein